MNHIYNSFLNKNLDNLISIYQRDKVKFPEDSCSLVIKINEENKIDVFIQKNKDLSPEQQIEIKSIKNRNEKLLNRNRHVVTCQTRDNSFELKEFYLVLIDPKEEYILRGYEQQLTDSYYTYEFETFREKDDEKFRDEDCDEMPYENGGVCEISNFKGKWNIHDTNSGQKFLRVCRLALLDNKESDSNNIDDKNNEITWDNFRGLMDYQNIIIGGDNERAEKYYELHQQILEANIDKIKECDKVGEPPITKTGFSTYTLRCLHTYLDLKKYFGNWDDKKIIEIGSGHGGLCHLISNMEPTFQSYTLVDLPIVNQLAEKYLNEFSDLPHDKIKFMSCEQIIPRKYDLMIAEYSFSELDAWAQKSYLEKVVKYCKNAYLAMNVWEPKMKEYLKTYLEKLFETVEEYPEEPKSEYPNYIWVCRNK